MLEVKYGTRTIHYTVLEKEGLKSRYISVEKHQGVILKGKPVTPDKANKLILKKAKWILEKLKIVGEVNEEDIVTGSRIPYLGRSYYVQVFITKKTEAVTIEFNHSRFKIYLPNKNTPHAEIKNAVEDFYKARAVEKITPRVKQLSAKINLPYTHLRFLKMEKRWGSCTGKNSIIINTDAIKLPYTLIDYLIIHELCHTKVKDHSKDFWAELSKHVPNWRELNEQVEGMRF
jgi:hypothetical protein